MNKNELPRCGEDDVLLAAVAATVSFGAGISRRANWTK